MTNSNIWMANQYISGNASDGGKTRIPTLTLAPLVGSGLLNIAATTNEDKNVMLAKLMFPAHSPDSSIPSVPAYPPSYTPW